MTNKKIKQFSSQSQIDLFQSTKRLNLSDTYEAVPKSVSIKDPRIKWVSDNIAESIEKPFMFGNKIHIAEINPANFKNEKTGVFKSYFPNLRENRIEYAIISLASKDLDVDIDRNNNKIFRLKTTYYQIQKEITDAINKRENKELKPNDCPYNTGSIKEALQVLKRTDISVKDTEGKKIYIFNRIKEVYMEDKKVVIELGNMVTDYIATGDWRGVDKASILASKQQYEMQLRVLLNLNFRYASKKENKPYSPSLNFLIQKIDFIENKEKRITLQKIIKLLEAMHEVDKVEYEPIKDGRKIIDASINIFPSNSFIDTMIINNKINRSIDNAEIGTENELIIEPIEENYYSALEYSKAKREYEISMGKLRLKTRHNI